MAHRNQKIFCEITRSKFPQLFEKAVLVLDVGSLDINGNNRYLFGRRAGYIGLDLQPGKNINVTKPVHELESFLDNLYDIIISTECFEHDAHYKKSFKRITELLAPGGMFLFTCATTGRHSHGITGKAPNDSPFTGDYYRNLTEEDVREAVDIDAVFSDYEFSTNDQTHDLYFWGLKKEGF